MQELSPDASHAQLDALRRSLDAERERNAELTRALSQAHRMTAIGQLAAGIAHEINTPIQFVGDSVYFLQEAFSDLQLAISAGQQAIDRLPDEEERRQKLEELASCDLDFLDDEIPKAFNRVRDGIRQVALIVGAMKEFAHPDDRLMSECDLQKMVQSVLVVTRGLYKHIATVVVDAGELPLVTCHPGDINRVFLNLIANAADAIRAHHHGQVGVGRIHIELRAVDDNVQIRVTDNGGGIPPEVRPRVFEPFFTTKRLGKGTGQGLAIVRDIVESRHGGSLSFEVHDDVGTTFIVVLPVRSA